MGWNGYPLKRLDFLKEGVAFGRGGSGTLENTMMFEIFLITFINDLAPTAGTADTTVEAAFGVAEYNLANTRLTFTVEGTWHGRPQEVYAPHAELIFFACVVGGQKG